LRVADSDTKTGWRRLWQSLAVSSNFDASGFAVILIVKRSHNHTGQAQLAAFWTAQAAASNAGKMTANPENCGSITI
jgi:hypothetical protein